MKKKYSILQLIINTLFLIVFSNNKIKCFRCGANELKLNPYHIKDSNDTEKRRLDEEYSPLKIGVDYSSFLMPSKMRVETFNFIKNVIEDTLNEFKKFLKVRHKDIDLTELQDEIKESCELDLIGADFNNFLIDNDVIIFPKFYINISENIHAGSAYCLTNGVHPRPVAGVLFINPDLPFNKFNSNIYLKHLIFHEVTHILVFDPKLLNILGMTEKRNSIIYVNSENVLSKAKEHFNCNSLTGLPLEDQGEEEISGYHWEARYMLGDYMISTDYLDIVISDITIALFEDTKYYQVEYYSGGLFKFGKNKGCNFLNNKCLNNEVSSFKDEFCDSETESMCSSTRTNKGNCKIIDYSFYDITIPSKYQYFSDPNRGGFLAANFCPVVEGTNNLASYFQENCRYGISSYSPEYSEVISENSFCFISSLMPSTSLNPNIASRPICYKVECDKNTKKTIVYVRDSTFICPTNGGIITGNGFKGVLNCPNYLDICTSETNKLCNEMFDCLNKKIKKDVNSFIFNEEEEIKRFIFSEKIQINSYIILIIFILLF